MTIKGKGRSPEDHTQEFFPDTGSDGNSSDATSEQSFDQFGRYMVSRLSRIIEGDIIPRLMLALDSPNSTRKDETIADRLRDNVNEFVHLIIAHDASVAVRYISTLRTDGIPLSALYLFHCTRGQATCVYPAAESSKTSKCPSGYACPGTGPKPRMISSLPSPSTSPQAGRVSPLALL